MDWEVGGEEVIDNGQWIIFEKMFNRFYSLNISKIRFCIDSICNC